MWIWNSSVWLQYLAFHYGQMEWEAGSASGGTNGQGGTAPRIGFSNAINTFYELTPYSGVNGVFLSCLADLPRAFVGIPFLFCLFDFFVFQGPTGAKAVSNGTNVGNWESRECFCFRYIALIVDLL